MGAVRISLALHPDCKLCLTSSSSNNNNNNNSNNNCEQQQQQQLRTTTHNKQQQQQQKQQQQQQQKKSASEQEAAIIRRCIAVLDKDSQEGTFMSSSAAKGNHCVYWTEASQREMESLIRDFGVEQQARADFRFLFWFERVFENVSAAHVYVINANALCILP